jgi:hypothetical protein
VKSLNPCVSVLSKTTKDALIRPLWSHLPTPENASDFQAYLTRKGSLVRGAYCWTTRVPNTLNSQTPVHIVAQLMVRVSRSPMYHTCTAVGLLNLLYVAHLLAYLGLIYFICNVTDTQSKHKLNIMMHHLKKDALGASTGTIGASRGIQQLTFSINPTSLEVTRDGILYHLTWWAQHDMHHKDGSTNGASAPFRCVPPQWRPISSAAKPSPCAKHCVRDCRCENFFFGHCPTATLLVDLLPRLWACLSPVLRCESS